MIELSKNSGQAVVESIVLFLILSLFFAALIWISKIGDISLEGQMHSRYVAFQATRQGQLIDSTQTKEMNKEKSQLWKDLKGNSMLSSEQILTTISRDNKINATMQPGATFKFSEQLRKEWDIEDEGIVKVQVDIGLISLKEKTKKFLADLDFLSEVRQLSIKKQTAILAENAHQSSDLKAHEHFQKSSLAWQNSSQQSLRLANQINEISADIDAAWKREKLNTDWVKPWAGQLPKHHLIDNR